MKRLLVFAGALLAAVALYTTTAPAGQQVVTPKQFSALKKQVATLQKDMKNVKLAVGALLICSADSAAPLTNAPALHVSGTGETTDFYAVTTTKECADAMNTPSFRRLLAQIRG